MRTRLLLAVIIALAVPPSASANARLEIPRLPGSTLPGRTIPVVAGPAPAGEALVFASGNEDRGWTVRLAAPGAPIRDIATIAPEEGSTLGLVASASRLVAVRHAEACSDCKYMTYDVTLDALLAGPLGGPLAQLARCGAGAQPCPSAYSCGPGGGARFAVALAGDLLAVQDRCFATALVTNLSSGASRALGSAEGIAVAGSLVAVAEPAPDHSRATVVVRDATSGAELYRAGLPGALPFPQLGLLPDGTVVYVALAGDRAVLAAASPAAPAGHVVRLMPGGTVLSGVGPAGALLTSRSPPGVQLVPLDGSPSPVPPVAVPNIVGEPAFDGRTVTWAQRTCVTATITSWRIGDPPPAAPDLRCPTPRPESTALRLSRDRRVRVTLGCPATARGGCLATARLTAVRRGRMAPGAQGAERYYRLGSVRMALDPGTSGRGEVAVSRGAARWARRHRGLRVRIDVFSDAEHAAERPAHDSGVVHRTVALRAAR